MQNSLYCFLVHYFNVPSADSAPFSCLYLSSVLLYIRNQTQQLLCYKPTAAYEIFLVFWYCSGKHKVLINLMGLIKVTIYSIDWTNFVGFSLVIQSERQLAITTTQHTTAQTMHTASTVGKTQLGEPVATAAWDSGGDVSVQRDEKGLQYIQ